VGADRAAAEKAAGSQLHRQRMGAIMGPTICKQRFLLSDDASDCLGLLQKMLTELKPLAKLVPKAFDEPETAKTHIAAYRDWLSSFMKLLGYNQDGGYVELHLLRKYVLVQAVKVQQNGLPDGIRSIGSAMSGLNEFSCLQWFPKTETMAALRAVVPDEADYLRELGGVMRPWQL
jgi:hypothetical protein